MSEELHKSQNVFSALGSRVRVVFLCRHITITLQVNKWVPANLCRGNFAMDSQPIREGDIAILVGGQSFRPMSVRQGLKVRSP